MADGLIIKVDAALMKNKLKLYEVVSDIAVGIFAEHIAKEFESYAKEHRRWTDRTGHARQRLKGYTIKTKDHITIGVAHGVSYGLNLEFDYEKKYAILKETIMKNSPEALKAMRGLLDDLKELKK